MTGTSFDSASHKYLIDGKPATGITTIIGVLAKPALIGWAAKMAVIEIEAAAKYHDIKGQEMLGILASTQAEWDELMGKARTAHTRKKDAAATHGTDAHALVEDFVNYCLHNLGGRPEKFLESDYDELHDKYQGKIDKFIDWARENVDHFLFSERQMYNREKFIAGTADFGAVMKDGKKLIGDFKTSSGVFGIDYFLQCAGYKFLAEAEGDEPYDGCVIVRLGKKGPSDFDVTYRYDNKTDAEAFMACLTIYRAQQTWKK